MIVSPSKIKKNRILTGRTINFETVKKTHGNIVVIPTLDKDAFIATINSNLFRPTQLMALYINRRIRPRGKGIIALDQKEYYKEVRELTFGKIKKGKTLMNAYSRQNLVYDIYSEYILNRDAYSKIRKNRALQMDLIKYMENLFVSISEDPDYESTYIVFPMEKPYENPQKTLISCTDFSATDPLSLFLLGLKEGIIDPKSWTKIKGIFFYVPSKDILMSLDIDNPEFEKDLPSVQQRIRRLNALNSGEISIDDVSEDADAITEPNVVDGVDQDILENRKEEIKKIILGNIAKKIKANLTDFDAASSTEKDIIVLIDDKIEKFLGKKENLKKTIDELATELENDNEIKNKAIKYVETKKASILRNDILSKGLEKEVEAVSQLQDLDDEGKDNVAEVLEIDVPYIDDRITTSHLISLEKEYNKKQMNTDLANTFSAFSEMSFFPATIDSITTEDTSTYSDEKVTYNVRYKTNEGKPLSFQLDVPKIVDDRYLYLGGNKKVIKKQLFRLPITKIAKDTVEVTSNFNKITVERSTGKISRKLSYMLKKLREVGENKLIEIDYGDNTLVNSKLGYFNDFSYEEVGGSINSIKTLKYKTIFNRDIMRIELSSNLPDDILPDDYFDRDRTPFGFEMLRDDIKAILFIENKIVNRVDLNGNVTSTGLELVEFIYKEVLNLDLSVLPSVGKSFVYTNMKFLATKYPVLAVVASQNGLTDILKRYVGEGNFYKTKKQEKNNIDYVEIKFKDTYLYYKDEVKNTLLLNAMYLMSPQDYNYAEFDADVPYTQFFIKTLGPSVGMHTRNTLRINLDVMIDPITRDVLRDLKQPTNIIDALLYANTLLVNNQYKTLNDATNYRIRSNELVPAIMYKLIAEAYVSYEKHKLNGRPSNLSLPRGALIKKLFEQENINDKSTLNPVIECEQIAQSSAKGHSGVNINDAYTLEMRAYDRSMEGFISGNSTPYSGQAGITRALTYDPAITSVRGYIPTIDETKLSAANTLSPTELLSSFTAAGADAPRQAMQVAQTGHTMPIKSSSKQLIGSGMNKTLAFMISDDFAFKAKKDGIVTKIDSENKLALLTYDDGTKDAVDLSTKLDKNSGMGFYIHQLFKFVYSEGERFKAGDVLAYNPSYFTGKGKNVDYKPGTLAKVAIASIDTAFEDSTTISESLAERCASKINMLKQVSLGKNAVIHSIKEIGDTVNTGDHIIEFTNSFDDEDTVDFLDKLRQNIGDDEMYSITNESVDAKFAGVITNIEICYNCPFEELHPSIQELITKYRAKIAKRTSLIADVKTGSVHVPPIEQMTERKVMKKEFVNGGGVIINVWVEYDDVMGKGDKLTFNTALKRSSL